MNNVDYGQFIGELKTVVEPCLTAYRYRNRILRAVHERYSPEDRSIRGNLLIIGPAPARRGDDGKDVIVGLTEDGEVNQTGIFVDTLRDLVENSAFRRKSIATEGRRFRWVDPSTLERQPSPEKWKELVQQYSDCVVLIDNPEVDVELIRLHAKNVIVANDYRFEIDPDNKLALPGMKTAANLKAEGDEDALITVSYLSLIHISEPTRPY